MAKTRRGRALWTLPGRGKGLCPGCSRTGVKLLYQVTLKGENTKVCKRCRH
jgi:hypothetical protein